MSTILTALKSTRGEHIACCNDIGTNINIYFVSSIIEEAMEDGMWIVVSNCDQDRNFWTLVNFKLYQLKLEARVNPNYWLFIVIRQSSASVIPK